MRPRLFRLFSFLAASIGILSLPAIASDPVGIYALVEKVVIEPGEDNAQRIQVWGVFAISDGKSGDGYLQPQRGYLYFTLNPGKEDVCKKEWNDLKSVAGTGQGVGFGRRYQQNGRVRKTGEKLDSPDVYPIGFGMVRMRSLHNQPGILAELNKLLRGE